MTVKLGMSVTNLTPNREPSAAELIADMELACRAGLQSIWLNHHLGYDSLTLLAAAAPSLPNVELGTAVIPTYPRHPAALAMQALTAQVLSGGRLTLGVGASHADVIKGLFGLEYASPVNHLAEYLTVLTALLNDQRVRFEGNYYSVRCQIAVEGATPVPIVVGAMGDRMLELAGAQTDGVIPVFAGPRTLEAHIVPKVSAAAEQAGRGRPRVLVEVPMCLTEHVDQRRLEVSEMLAPYESLPVYLAVKEREGAQTLSGLAMLGDEESLRAGITRLADAGATDVVAIAFGDSDERARTLTFLGSLNSKS
jgi:5,10-methylenetetrahydromethanopterin reductase